MTRQLRTIRRTFASLNVRNYRVFLIGQGISLCGTWMQRVAQSWLVLDMTGSGTAVGGVAALQFLPTLILSPIAGLIADRTDKRRVLFITQTVGAISALALGLVVLAGAAQLWIVYVLAFCLGLSTSLEAPVRQTFVIEMVGRSQLTNAVSLHSTLTNAARVVGPSFAGLLIASIGIGWCFVVNAASYMALIGALLAIRTEELNPAEKQPRSGGQLREGIAYARNTPAVAWPLLLMGVAGMFAFEYEVVLPMFARFTFAGGASAFAAMTAAMGVGAVGGGLFSAWRGPGQPVTLGWTAISFGGLQILVAISPTLSTALAALVLLGGASVAFIALGNSTLQLVSDPSKRGRVMGLYFVAFIGTTPVGGPLMGWVGEHFGARSALALGGLALITVGLVSIKRLLGISHFDPI